MIDQNVLKRHVKPAARELGLPFVNWRCLRTSHATWLVQAGAPEIGTRSKAALAHFDHDGNLRSDRAVGAAAGVAAALGVCGQWSAGGAADGAQESRLFGVRGSAFQFTFQNVPNQLSFR
jgi:hypothetical protein